MKFRIEDSDNNLKIYVNNILHLSIKKEELTAIKAYVEGNKVKNYIIEFYLSSNTITVTYDKFTKWKSVLKLLNKTDLYSYL